MDTIEIGMNYFYFVIPNVSNSNPDIEIQFTKLNSIKYDIFISIEGTIESKLPNLRE